MPAPGRRAPVVARLMALVVSLAVVVGYASAPAALAATDAPGSGATEQTVTLPVRAEPDGTCRHPRRHGLRPRLARAASRRPARARIRRLQGLPHDRASALHGRGYVVLMAWSPRVTARPAAGSTSTTRPTRSPTRRALLDLAAARSDVELDAPGDPRAGVVGGSYGGALGLMLAGTDPRVDGVVSAITWNDLADAFFPQAAVPPRRRRPAGRAPIATPGPFKQVWATNFFLSASRGASAGASSGPATARAATTVPPPPTGAAASTRRSAGSSCRRAETGTASPELTALLRAHSPRPRWLQVSAPTFLVQGVADSLFGLDQADANAQALAASGHAVCRPVE